MTNRIIGLGAACALTAGTMAFGAPTARAQQQPSLVTFTFKLTINNEASPGDSFAVTWGETGLEMCSAPCAGDGHTYVRTMTFPVGVTETFTFVRAPGAVSPEHPGQRFATQTITANADRSVSAVYTYGVAAVPVPATGSQLGVLSGSLVDAVDRQGCVKRSPQLAVGEGRLQHA